MVTDMLVLGIHFVNFGHYLSHKGDYFGNPPPHTSHRPPVYLHQQEASVHTRNSSCEEMALHLQPLLCFDSSSTHRAGFRSASGGGGRGKASTAFSGRHSRQGHAERARARLGAIELAAEA